MTFAATEVAIRPTAFDAPEAADLIAALQQEYLIRYGGHDETPVEPGEFAPPEGYFVVAWMDDRPVGCGGWRDHSLPGSARRTAEIKRMYVAGPARRRGVARLILADLERAAAAAGFDGLILESGDQQPEAIALYAAAGYVPTTPFGLYAGETGAIHLTKDLPRARR